MNTERRRIDRDTAERLLRGAAATRRVGGPLADQLVAASAPARPHELLGEAAALAAFRAAAHLDPVPRPRRSSMIKTWLAHLLTVKAAAILAVTTAGGVALAASTGTIPNPLTDRPATGRGMAHAIDRPATASRSAEASRSAKGGASALPSPSMVGLCHAVTAGAGSEHGKALENPAFTALITAAGGKDKVAAFCTALLASSAAGEPGNKGNAQPTATPTANPTGGADRHGNGPPGGHPTGHPTGPPASHPGH